MTAGIVAVYTAPAVDRDEFRAVLSAAERERLSALLTPASRAGFGAAHALLRVVLAGGFGCAPGEVIVQARCATCGGPHGRPVVRRPGAREPGPHVSLAHTRGLVLVAVTGAGEVGVDVEVVDRAALAQVDGVALAPQERRAIANLAGDEAAGARATTWVRKEALLKATGQGLSVEPRDVVLSSPVRSGPDAPPRLLAWPAGVPAPGRPVHLADVCVGPGRVAAVAVLADLPPAVRVADGSHLLSGCLLSRDGPTAGPAAPND